MWNNRVSILKSFAAGIFVFVLLIMSGSVVQASEFDHQAEVYPSGEDFWLTQKGDYFAADVKNNRGYFIHPNGTSYEFPIITGQRRYVYYIGRYYFAGTPVRSWEIDLDVEIKDDKVTFGSTGRFFRLFDHGKSSSYGIHGHRNFQAMLDSGDLYRSMGCIIVPEPILDIFQKVYDHNGGMIRVETFEGTEIS